MAQTAGPGLVREVNRRLVLDLFRDGSRLSKADVVRLTGLTKPSVSAIVDELLREGLLADAGLGESGAGGGRRPRLLEFNPASAAYVGIHLGVPQTVVAVANALGRTLAEVSAPAAVGEPARALASLRPLAERAARRAGVPFDRVRAVGVSVSGLVDQRTGVCVLAPNLDWHRVPLLDEVAALFGLPVAVYNEAQAGALAESRQGAAAHVRSFVRLVVGVGIGSGVVLDSVLFTGSRGISGEVGHCAVDDDGPPCRCGRRGCLETRASTRAVVRMAHEAIERGEPTSLEPGCDLPAIVRAAEQGDRVAREALERAGDALGRGISYLVNILNPELVVLGGPVAAAGSLILDPVRRSVSRHVPDEEQVPVVLTALTRAEVEGAVLLARQLVDAPRPLARPAQALPAPS